ncbi:MAG: hypothetical protein AB4041_08650 [Microcystaceae cyanobacterium]
MISPSLHFRKESLTIIKTLSIPDRQAIATYRILLKSQEQLGFLYKK